MAKKHLLGPFDWFLLVGIVACNVINSIMTNSFDIIGTISSVAGIVCVVLCANGSIVNYLFGLINVTLYAYICYKSQLWGAAALNGLYYTPMQFIGFFQWRKRDASVHKAVKAQRMDGRKWLYVALGYVAVAAVAFGISYFAGQHSLGSGVPAKLVMDALTTAAYVMAIIMMTFAYMEQWYIWTLVNLSSIVLWAVNLATTPESTYTVVMLIKYVFYLLNGLNAIRIWLRLSRKEEVLEN